MVPDNDIDEEIAAIRYDSIASIKFMDTSIGGNLFINPRPQFNPFTDPKTDNVVLKYNRPSADPKIINTGMGEGYSELIDDNQQVVYLEFGLPKFNSVIDFFFRAVDYQDSVLANTGRPATSYHAGQAIGGVAMFIAFPVMTATILAGKFLLSALIGDKSLKYYYFNSKMSMYWGVVNTLVTQLVTEQGLLSPVIMNSKNTKKGTPDVTQIGMPTLVNQGDIDAINELLGHDVFGKTNYIDVYSIVTRAQRAAIIQKETMYAKLADGKLEDPTGVSKSVYPTQGILDELNHWVTFGDYTKKLNKIDQTKGDPKPKPPVVTKAKQKKDTKFIKNPDTGVYDIPKNKDEDSFFERFKKTFDSSFRQGASYAIFAVDYVGSSSESFSNSVTNIGIGEQAKQMNSKSRALSYNLARGDIFGDTMAQDVINSIKDLGAGILNSVSFGLNNVVQSLSGSAYIEVPKRWDESSMSFQQHTYSMQLIAPYNSFVSRLQNIFIPLCMLLGGTLPLATGKSSYTSPFLCKLYSRSVSSIELGMITSLNITRGTSNLAYDKKRNPLAIDVSFTVTDFSTLVTSPVNSSIFTDFFSVTMEDDTPLGNYISVLGGRDIITAKYASKQIAMRLSKRYSKLEQVFNVNRLGVWAGNSLDSTLGFLVSARNIPPINQK